MGNFTNTQPRCPSCTICCSKAVSAKTMSLTIAGMTPASGSGCNCNLLNTTYVFGAPTIYYPYSSNGQRLSICSWNLPFAWACTTAGIVITSEATVCILYNGTPASIGSYGCTGFDVFGTGLPSGHTRIGVVLRGAQSSGSAVEFESFWLSEYSSSIDCALLSNLSIPFDGDPFLLTRRCAGAATPATATINLH